MILGYRPCGACAALVPEVTGCRHWKPGLGAGLRRNDDRKRNRSYRGSGTGASVADLIQTMGRTYA